MIKNRLQHWLRLTIVLFVISNNLSFGQYYDISTTSIDNNNYSATLAKKLLLDNQGFLWYSTFNGIIKEMGSHVVFFEYNESDNVEDVVFGTRQLLLTSKNKVIACTEKGVKIIDVSTSETNWISAKYPETNSTVDFTSAMEDKKGNIWLGTSKNYLYCYTKDEKLIYTKIIQSVYRDVEILGKRADIIIEAILEDGSILIEQAGEWYVVIDTLSYYLFNSKSLFPDKKERRMISIPNGYVMDKDSSGQVEFEGEIYYYKYIPDLNVQIVQTVNAQLVYVPGIYQETMVKPLDFIFYEGDNIRLGKITRKKEDSYIIKEVDKFVFDKTINDVIIDPRGYVLAQSQKGISKIQYKNSGFTKYLDDYKKYNQNKNISCRAPVEDSKGNIFVHTYSGLFKKGVGDSDFKKVTVTLDEKVKNHFETLTYNIHLLDDDHILAFGYYRYIIKLNVKTGASEIIEIPKNSKRPNITTYDAEKFKDDLLLTSSRGIYRYSREFDTISEFNFENTTLLTNGVFDIVYSEKNNTIWAASNTGLFKVDLDTNDIERFTKTSETLKLLTNDVKVVYEDSDFNIWIGTSKGAQKINPETLETKSYTSLNGLINDHISGIQESDNSMWLATFEGLVKLNKKTNDIQLYLMQDGLPDNELNFKSELKDKQGNLYFGGINGLVKFNPKVVTQKSQVFELFLTEYEKFDKTTNATKLTYNPIDKTPDFNIPYYKNYITLTFAINDITHPENNKYQYRIKKLGADWIDLGSYNIIQLIGLQPNNYTLEVKGYSSNGQPTNILTYNLKVEQVFYKTYWFIALCILSILAFITWFNYIRREKMKLDYNQKIKVQQLESKAMRAQMNPHFIFNTLNGMQSVMLLKGEREVNKYFTAFSKLIRLTLDMSDSEYVLLKDEIRYIESYLTLEQIRLNDRLKTNLYVDPELDIENQSIPCMLFQPIIENALIHGLTPKKDNNLQLDISLKRKGSMLIAEVTDNGIGREAAGKMKERSRKDHKSWATHIMNERINISNSLSNQKIDFDIIDLKKNSQPSGTKVVIKIPLRSTIETL